MTNKLSHVGIILTIVFLFSSFINFKANAAATTVTICHATASTANPYVKITVAVASLGNGHGNNGVNPGDIIPPTPGTDFPNGNNWNTTGQAIYNNNCSIPTATPTPTIKPTATPTPTTKPTPTPTNTPTPTSTTTPTPTIEEGPTATPTPTNTLTPTPTIGEPTPTPPDNHFIGNTCSIINLLNSTSRTGGNNANSNTGGSTNITSGNATTNTTINSQCGVNVVNLHITGMQHTDINILGDGVNSNNSVLLTNNTVVQIFQ